MYLKINGINLYYEKKGSGQPFILLHGNGEDHHLFDDLINLLSANYEVYAIDSRDHGKSEKSKVLSYDLMACDLLLFCNELKLENVILCGFSDGGIIGILSAHQSPQIFAKMILCGLNTKPQTLKFKWRLLIKICYLFTHSKKLRLMIKEPDITKEMLNSINFPTLILAGSKDMIKEEDTLFIANEISDSKLIIIDNATHDSYIKNNKILYSKIENFIKKDAL